MSTNKTPNLNLHSWIGTDYVKRSEFNENFSIIDAEIVKKATPTQDGRMSKEDKAKLDGIEAGAQVNKVLSVNGKTGEVSLTAADVGASPSNHTHSVATTSSSGFMSATDKAKLDGIEAGAQKNTVTSVNGKTGVVSLTASDVGAETPDGAQAKADKAEQNAKTYADSKATTAENNAKAYADNKATQAETNAKNASLPRTGGDVTGLLRVRHNEFRVGANDDFIIRPVGNGDVDISAPNGNLAPHFNGALNFYKGLPGSGVLKFSVRDDGAYVPAGKLATEALVQAKADQAETNAKGYLDGQKGKPNGVATLDASGKVPASQLNISMTGSAISITDSGGYYNGSNVEDALQEIGQVLNAMRGSLITSVNNVLNM